MNDENAGGHPFARRRVEEQAIRMALDGRWQEAAQLNLLLLEEEPNDVNALNRLGKAQSEMGEYENALASYSRALEVDPYNRIARRNMDRLAELVAARKRRKKPPAPEGERILPDFFISESGKSAVLPLRAIAAPDVLQELRRGQVVRLHASGQTVEVKTEADQTLGRLDPRVGRRLAEFLQGGNRYVAAVVEAGERGVKVFVRETYQHPRFANRLSFPPSEATQSEIVRPYFRDLGFRLREALETEIDSEEEEEEEEGELEDDLDLDEDEDLLEETETADTESVEEELDEQE